MEPTATAAPPLPEPPARERRVLPVVAVALVLVGVVFGGYVTAGALDEPTGEAIDVGGVVHVFPLSGWELSQRFGDPPGIRLTRGNGNLDVATVPFTGTDEELLRGYVEGVLEPDASQLSVSPAGRVRAAGLDGLQVLYVGSFGDVQTPIEGQVTVVVSPSGTGVVFDAWAPYGSLQPILDDIGTMVARTEVA